MLTLGNLPDLLHLRKLPVLRLPRPLGRSLDPFLEISRDSLISGPESHKHDPGSLQRDAVVVSHLIVYCERADSRVYAEEALLGFPHLDIHVVSGFYSLLFRSLSGIRYDEPPSDLSNSGQGQSSPNQRYLA